MVLLSSLLCMMIDNKINYEQPFEQNVYDVSNLVDWIVSCNCQGT